MTTREPKPLPGQTRCVDGPVPAIDLDPDPGFQRREWAVQRFGRAVIILLVFAGAAGAFGRGPLAGASTEAPGGGVRLSYDRLVRRESPTTLLLEVGPGVARSGELRVWIDQGYLRRTDGLRFVPDPEGMELAEDGYTVRFRAPESGRPATLRVTLEPSRFGLLAGEIRIQDASPIRFRQFVFP